LFALLISSVIGSSQTSRCDTINADIVSFFESGCKNDTIGRYFTDSTLTDLKGTNYTLTFDEFKSIAESAVKRYDPNKWEYIVRNNYFIVKGECKNITVIFSFEIDKYGMIDTVHVDKEKF
jgi:hypothetical protein